MTGYNWLINRLLRGRLERRFCWLSKYEQLSGYERRELESPYREYVSGISTPDMAVSLETAVFLSVLVKYEKLASVLDMGSGFSSFVFRRMLKEGVLDSVVTIDDDADWLGRTVSFLGMKGCSTKSAFTLAQLDIASAPGCDLVFYDLGRMPLRMRYLDSVLCLKKRRENLVFLDDMHKHEYDEYVRRKVSGIPGIEVYSVERWTIDGFGRFGALVI